MSAVAEVAPAPESKRAVTRLESISPSVRREIIRRVGAGVPAGVAATSCGIHRRTFQRWMEMGRQPDAKNPWRSFADAVDRAFHEWQASKIEQISGHAEKDWRAGAWQLERLVPETFADPNRTGGSTVNVQVTIAAEREQSAAVFLDAARRALADDPDALERLMLELGQIGSAEVVDGEIVAEIEA